MGRIVSDHFVRSFPCIFWDLGLAHFSLTLKTLQHARYKDHRGPWMISKMLFTTRKGFWTLEDSSGLDILLTLYLLQNNELGSGT